MHSYFKNLYLEIGNDMDLLIELAKDFKTIYFDSIENLKNFRTRLLYNG